MAKIIRIIAVFLFAFVLSTGITTAKAETTHTVEEVAENIFFVTFKKGQSAEHKNYLGAAFYFPNEYYEEEYEYGVAVFPEKFITKYELYGDYIARQESEGISVALVYVSGDRINGDNVYSFNIGNIPESGVTMRLAYVFYVRNSDGEVSYKEPVISSFSETTLENPTTETLTEMAKERQKVIATENQFKSITDKVSELVDSVWLYLVLGCSAVVVVWGAYIGIKIAVSKKNEQKIDGKGMVKRLVIGIVIMFVLAGALPLLIKGLAAWA